MPRKRPETVEPQKAGDGGDQADALSDVGEKMRPALMLSVAYSANIGGTGVVTGTAPNLILMSELKEWVKY